MTVTHCRKYWIDFKGGILLSRIIVLMPVSATPLSIIILSIPLATDYPTMTYLRTELDIGCSWDKTYQNINSAENMNNWKPMRRKTVA